MTELVPQHRPISFQWLIIEPGSKYGKAKGALGNYYWIIVYLGTPRAEPPGPHVSGL